MIDLVLQNPCVPARSFDRLRLAVFIKTVHPEAAITWDERHEPIQTQTAFEKFDFRLPYRRNRRIDNDVKSHRRTLALRELLGRKIPAVFGQIFDDRQLNSLAHLRGRQPYPGRVAESFTHEINKLMNARAVDFFQGEFAGRSSQYRLPDLH